MKNTLLLFSILLFILPPSMYAQNSGNINYAKSFQTQRTETPKATIPSYSEIEIDVKALMNVEADSYVAIFSLIQMGETISNVDTLMNERIQSIEAGLQKLQIRGKSFHIDMVSLVPMYAYEMEKRIFSKRTYIEEPKGFELKKNLHIRYKNPKGLSDIISICAQNEVYDLVKVDYVVKDVEAALDTLQQKAVALVKKKERVHRELGLDLTSKERIIAESNGVFYPTERYNQYTAFSSSSLDKVKKNVVVTDIQKSTTQYYQPIGYKGYDIVVHPEIVEPVVQYTYNLKVKYFLKKEEELKKAQEVKKEVYFLNSNGTLQKLNLD